MPQLSTQSVFVVFILISIMSKKDAIVHAATLLFSNRGFENTRMSEISRMTGAAEGTIFYHFKNKEELFLSILERFRMDVIAEFEGVLGKRQSLSGLEMMEETIFLHLSLASRMEDRFLLLHRHDAYELARINPVAREVLESIYNCFVDIFEKAIASGQEDGSIAPVPARKTAMIIFLMVDGLVRFNTYRLYDAGALYDDLLSSIRRILENPQPSG